MRAGRGPPYLLSHAKECHCQCLPVDSRVDSTVYEIRGHPYVYTGWGCMREVVEGIACQRVSVKHILRRRAALEISCRSVCAAQGAMSLSVLELNRRIVGGLGLLFGCRGIWRSHSTLLQGTSSTQNVHGDQQSLTKL